MREIKFRGKRVDNGEWVYGDLTYYPFVGIRVNGRFNRVIPETVGQLRYKNKDVEYYDGDVYYHAGYGNEIVSDLCELQLALMHGESDNIGEIIGNIHDNK